MSQSHGTEEGSRGGAAELQHCHVPSQQGTSTIPNLQLPWDNTVSSQVEIQTLGWHLNSPFLWLMTQELSTELLLCAQAPQHGQKTDAVTSPRVESDTGCSEHNKKGPPSCTLSFQLPKCGVSRCGTCSLRTHICSSSAPAPLHCSFGEQSQESRDATAG